MTRRNKRRRRRSKTHRRAPLPVGTSCSVPRIALLTMSALLQCLPLGLPAPGRPPACQPSHQRLLCTASPWPCPPLHARCIALPALAPDQHNARRWLCAGAGARQHAPTQQPQHLNIFPNSKVLQRLAMGSMGSSADSVDDIMADPAAAKRFTAIYKQVMHPSACSKQPVPQHKLLRLWRPALQGSAIPAP